MYNFLYSEVFWMEVIIASIISGAFALVCAFIAYRAQFNKDIQKIINSLSSINKEHENFKSDHTHLSSEHNSLSSEHKSLSSEHKSLSSEHKDLILSNSSIKECVSRTEINVAKLIDEMNIKKGADGNLKDIINNLNQFEIAIHHEINNQFKLNTEIENLNSKIALLTLDNNQLHEENRKLKEKLRIYKQKNIFDISAADNKSIDDYER